MRILITHHFPLEAAASGGPVRELAQALVGAGHDVHLLIVDREQPAGTEELTVRRVACRAGDPSANLAFDVPHFEAKTSGQQTFAGLSADQLARYRTELRKALDGEVDSFDPHVIHVEHVWVLGQLVLETGVPYVLRAWGPELAPGASPRLHALAQQAAENAGRIIAPDATVAAAVLSALEVSAERICLVPSSAPATAYLEIYRTVLTERFGGAAE
jgi:hypothetical protein